MKSQAVVEIHVWGCKLTQVQQHINKIEGLLYTAESHQTF